MHSEVKSVCEMSEKHFKSELERAMAKVAVLPTFTMALYVDTVENTERSV